MLYFCPSATSICVFFYGLASNGNNTASSGPVNPTDTPWTHLRSSPFFSLTATSLRTKTTFLFQHKEGNCRWKYSYRRLHTTVPSQLCGFQVLTTRLAACLYTGSSNAAFRIAYPLVFVCACTEISGKRWTKPSSSPRHRHDHQQGLKTIISVIY